MKNPSESIAEYKANLLENNTKIVEQISSSSKSQYQHYQTQHQAFVNHALQQIQVSCFLIYVTLWINGAKEEEPRFSVDIFKQEKELTAQTLSRAKIRFCWEVFKANPSVWLAHYFAMYNGNGVKLWISLTIMRMMVSLMLLLVYERNLWYMPTWSWFGKLGSAVAIGNWKQKKKSIWSLL